MEIRIYNSQNNWGWVLFDSDGFGIAEECAFDSEMQATDHAKWFIKVIARGIKLFVYGDNGEGE